MAGELERGRESYARRAWEDAHDQLSAADTAMPLGGGDLELLAQAAYLIGRDETSADVWARAHREWLRAGETARAVRAAFWLAFGLLNKGEMLRAGGWIERSQRLLHDADFECGEQGLLHYLVGLRCALTGDAAGGQAAFTRGVEIGERFGDDELVVLARIGLGRCLIYQGEIGAALALLDEAMVAVTGGELSPMAVGDAYCTVIEGCRETFDVRRSQVWTAELSRWCAEQPALVAYRGQCLIHRSETLQLSGAWDDAMDEARLAADRLSRPSGQLAIGAATYQQGELHRLRGEFGQAEAAYRDASRLGREPQPGMALLRLAQGRPGSAAAAIRAVVEDAHDRVSRSRLLPAYVEVLLAVGDIATAHGACRELEELSAGYRSEMLYAVVSYTRGAVDLVADDAKAALTCLRRAKRQWQELDVPYEVARTRALMASACRALGDDDTTELELAAAEEAFAELGAAGDLARIRSLSKRSAPDTHGLTPRELEILRLLCTGGTNKAIAAQLVLSDRTVDRHVSSIFAKLGVSSRSAATAYAYRHELL